MEKSEAKTIIERLPDIFGEKSTKVFDTVPPKSELSSAKNLVGYGTIKGFAVFRDVKTREFVILSMDITSTVDAVSNEALAKQVDESVLSKGDAKKTFVTIGVAQYEFPELKKSGYYVLERGRHTWSKKKPVATSEVVEEKKNSEEEVHF